jgi:hypothetical protein
MNIAEIQLACRFCHDKKGSWAWQCYTCGEIDDVQQPAPPPKQEPVAWMSSDRAWMWSDYSKAIAAVANIPALTLIPLYAAPPQRPWVGLTPEEIQFYALKHRQLVNAHYDAASDTNIITAAFEATVFYETVEQALKERNHG